MRTQMPRTRTRHESTPTTLAGAATGTDRPVGGSDRTKGRRDENEAGVDDPWLLDQKGREEGGAFQFCSRDAAP
jgi:hypothetical protein